MLSLHLFTSVEDSLQSWMLAGTANIFLFGRNSQCYPVWQIMISLKQEMCCCGFQKVWKNYLLVPASVSASQVFCYKKKMIIHDTSMLLGIQITSHYLFSIVPLHEYDLPRLYHLFRKIGDIQSLIGGCICHF